jgi:hypothetical protein
MCRSEASPSALIDYHQNPAASWRHRVYESATDDAAGADPAPSAASATASSMSVQPSVAIQYLIHNFIFRLLPLAKCLQKHPRFKGTWLDYVRADRFLIIRYFEGVVLFDEEKTARIS